MIVDVHTHFLRPELDFAPRLRADMARCGVDPAALGLSALYYRPWLHEIVTHALPFAQWPEAFALARDGHDRALKVALTFPETK